MSSIRFRPWIGKNYRSADLRMLVVGESHYDWPNRRVPVHDVTREVIRWDITGFGKGGITDQFIATCIGHWPTRKERASALHSICFYNYVQSWVGAPKKGQSTSRPRRPTRKQWEDAKRVFL
jgi:hypothetical protein